MINNTDEQQKHITYDAIKIGLASPERIREWSHGEVKKPETINYRTLKPEKDGLFCAKIFGPTKDYECGCGKYKKIRYKGVVCDRCGVEVTKSSVRRERMGHIELAAPVSHIWYFKGIPSRMGLILDVSPKNLEKVLYFAAYIVLDVADESTGLVQKQVLSEQEYQDAKEKYGEDSFRAGMGAESVMELLMAIDLDEESAKLKEELENSSGQKRARVIKRLQVVEAFRESGNKPEWMILTVIPVIPPDLRPMVQLDGGRFATSDMNDLYRRIINRNNRLKKLLELPGPDIMVRNEKRMLQEAVDALIDNGRRGRPVTGPANRPLKSLSELLKGKQGRFRQNLLGKRVDYSGRSVIVVGPELKIYQCGLPKEMAIELFKPFVMHELTKDGTAHNIKAAKKMVERLDPVVWDELEKVIQEHPVMLNRAPTLHRLSIQAFEPVLVEGKAIKLHPLSCMAFNADFDGDQMAVHLPLSVEAQAEARFLMLSPNNLLKPSDGGVVAVPTQDMVLGIYYLTQVRGLANGDEKPALGEGSFYKDMNEALLAYANHDLILQATIKVRRFGKDKDGNPASRIVSTTLGRLILNEAIPQDLGFVDRSDPDNFLKPEVDFLVKKKQLKQILEKCMKTHGATGTAEVEDRIKALGYKFSTRAAMTVSISDMTVPESKQGVLDAAQTEVDNITELYERGLLTDDERHNDVIKTWDKADKQITKDLLDGLDKYNNIHMMADSGARGSDQQIKQLAGMRGLMADTQGNTIELPIKSNFREGLDVLEYFISAHGARKGLSDTALRTADSGYLTRRLVDVSQELIIRETDCAKDMDEIPGMEIGTFRVGKELIESLEERITGRFACDSWYDDDGNLIVKKNHMITAKRAHAIVNTKKIIDQGDDAKVKVRTILTCHCKNGICTKCYGSNLATGAPVQVGEAVGIMAAQSIGEPGTQLTMRTFHTGGVAGGDITQGLPRVEELFEARKPKGVAIVTEIAGTVSISESKKKKEVNEVTVTNDDGDAKTYLIPYGSHTIVHDGDVLKAGDPITEGPINPHDILEIQGTRAVQDYILREVQRVYRLQGVEINDKHIEVIVRQMMKKITIDEKGDSDFLPGDKVEYLDFEETVRRLTDEGKEPPKGERSILGITKAALATDSFLSAASFQETTRVLTDAAIHGKIDPLIGLKENVILGKLIPAGTGMKMYRSVRLDCDHDAEKQIARIRKEKEDRLEAMKVKGSSEVIDVDEEPEADIKAE
ncbi:MAG: DNA-directed RNA polymerase subunit beta' [Lachnospiraceae bacterium]|jgi:DNA-directed RNA polymerase subunit beta'|nr:DNA-directed RNA polymerase subunit beta' [Lachnospiraceae bacterium]MEE3460677.1 DNA-directed RNA polymerase subunit beta' [Lachnospiraceae bacterium]